MSLSITPVYAAFLAILYVWLSLRIPRLRMKLRIGLGDGGNMELQRAIRVHANFAEYVPLALLLLAFLELRGYSHWFIHFLGLLLLVARGLHAHGLSQSAGTSPGRFLGTLLTLFTLLSCAILLLLSAVI